LTAYFKPYLTYELQDTTGIYEINFPVKGKRWSSPCNSNRGGEGI